MLEARPSELAITLATASAGRWGPDGWAYADEIRGQLRHFGFDIAVRDIASTLTRMAKADAPWLARQRCGASGLWTYRVTQYGACDVDNKLRGLKLTRYWNTHTHPADSGAMAEQEQTDA